MGEHDALFKRTFSVPEHAAAELRSVLPDVASKLQLDALELVAGSFVDEALASRHTDLLFRVPLRPLSEQDGPAEQCLVYFLFEHQSEPDAWMPFRLYEYFGRIWSAYLRENPAAVSLPPIAAVIVHHGEGGWTEATSMHEIIHGLSKLPELGRFVPSFDLKLDDLSRHDDISLQRRPMPLMARLVLWLLRDGRNTPRLLDRLLVWAQLLDELAMRDQRGDDINTLLIYVLRVAGDPPAEVIKQRVIEAVPSLERPMISAAEQLIQQGLVKGREEGREEGRREGVRSARIETLKRMLTKRFGAPTAEQTQRMEAASIEQLDVWLERILDATSIEETLAE